MKTSLSNGSMRTEPHRAPLRAGPSRPLQRGSSVATPFPRCFESDVFCDRRPIHHVFKGAQ